MKGKITTGLFLLMPMFMSAAEGVTDVIREAEGTEKLYAKEAAGTFMLGGIMQQYWDDFPAVVVWGEDNAVYFKDIISTMASDTYVKGTLEGNKIRIPANQTVEYNEEDGYGINIGVLKTEFNGNLVDFYYAPEVTEYYINIDSDGSMHLELPGEPFDGENPTEYILGAYYSDTFEFLGCGDYFQDYIPTELQPVTMPKDAEVLKYVYIDSFNYADLVDVAFYGDYLYIKGLSAMMPEGVIRARIEGNKAIVEQNEFLGIYMDVYFIMTKVLEANKDYDEEDPYSEPYFMAAKDAVFTLTIDDDKGTITAEDDGFALSLQPDENTYANSIGVFSDFTLRFQDSAAGIPANPTNLQYETRFAQAQGWNDFMFTLSNYSTEGKLLDVEGLFYQVLVNDEYVVFGERIMENLLGYDVLVYPGVPENQRWLPYGFNNNEDIFKFTLNEFDVGIYTNDVETIGVQTLYLYEGEVSYSGLVTLNVITGEVTEGEGSSVGTVGMSPVVRSEYYLLNGTKVKEPGRGIYIVRDIHSDGTTTHRKVAIK